MSVTLINRKGARLTLENIEGAETWWMNRLHQLYQRKVIAGYLIRP